MLSPFKRKPVALIAGLFGAAAAFGAHGQALERNPPPTPHAAPTEIAPPGGALGDQDPTPIGPALRAIVLLGPADAVRADAVQGVELKAVPRLSTQRMRSVLARYLGQPLSRRLIAQAQAAITSASRRAGYPFVSVSTPPQELTAGVLQLRVIEFRLGQISIQGAKPKTKAFIASRLRVQPGSPIAAAELSEDLDALNRYPFRHVDATFTPGADPGQTDLILNTAEAKPWSVYAGYSNSGSPSTGWDRYYAGFQAGGLFGPDSVLSNQATASPDALFDKSRPFHGVSHPEYLSDAVSLVAPVSPRAQIEASFDWVATSETSDPFVVRQTTYEARLGYRFALSNLGADFLGWGDGRFGIEAKHQEAETLFGGARAADLGVEVYQAFIGYSNTEADAWGRSDIDVLVHISPGDLSGANDKPQALLFSKGRADDVRYAYLGLTLDRYTKLPFGLGLTSQLIGQYSPRALQGTEQMGIGGQGLVRGYVLDDGAYDEAVVLRNELRGPALRLGPTAWADQISPYAFVDAGSGRDQHTGHTVSASSIGLGADQQIAGHLSVGLDGAYALTRAIETRAGDWRLETRASLAF